MTPNPDIQIRWLIRRDMPEVMEIERASFPTPWTDDDFLHCLRQRNCIGMVAERDHCILGFMVYELHRGKLVILNFAVHPEHRRNGVGAAMVVRLTDKLSQQRRNQITLDIRSDNFEAQAFFRDQGFLCHGITRGFYDDTAEDAYHFRFAIDGAESVFTIKDADAKPCSDGYPKAFAIDEDDD